ncbi:MAG TPA: BTAD domain-containing putative transcriptional regulator [Solirubrobacteraceae bacterium]|nr:BTAD domain-containing putative transcriptional regulator [Solirubrobacteraceae bacterium]
MGGAAARERHVGLSRAFVEGARRGRRPIGQDPAGYLLESDAYQLDAERFDALVELGRGDPARARASLTEALALWRGEPLADLPADGVIGEWRRTLTEKHLHARTLRIDADLAGGAAAELIAELEQLVRAHPFEERLCEQLMLALYRAGRQADALEAYDAARKRLVDELGLDPGPGLRDLQARILRQDATLSLSALPAGPAPAKVVLPEPTTRLIGRAVELLELERLTDDPFCRLITLVGPGGVGKTRLAIAHARRWAERFDDGAVFVGLARLTDPSQVRAEIASALARRAGTTEPNEQNLPRFLQPRELLLVLDNFEHVLSAADLVAELLEQAPGLRVLVTSRERLRLRGEHLFEVQPLATVDADGSVAHAPASELFISGARAIDRGFAADDLAIARIGAICRALDGLALAIELAAARTAVLTVQEISAQLAEPLSIGSGALRDLPERHQTLAETIRWSYDLLSKPAQRALRAASIFQGPFPLEALDAVAATPSAGELDDLLEASLVHRAGVDGRFRLLELVRAFGRERLIEAGEAASVQGAHRAYYVQRYADVAADEFPSEPGPTAQAMAPDHADLRAAITSAVAAGDGAFAVTLTKALQPTWMTGQLEESGTIVDEVLGAFSITAEEELYLLRMASFANSYRPSNKYWSQRRVTRAGELGFVGPQVAGLGNMIAQAFARRDFDEALTLRDQLLPLIDSPELRRRTRASGLWMLAGCAYAEEDLDEAYRLADESVQDAASDGHPHMLTIARTMRLEVGSARARAIELGDLSEIVEGALMLQIADVSVATLVCGARYVVNFDQPFAGELIAAAERLTADALGGDMWPEAQLRDETLQLLGLRDSAALLEQTPAADIAETLTRLNAWLSRRDPGERAPRTVVAPHFGG